MPQPPEKRLVTEASLSELVDAILVAGNAITVTRNPTTGEITVAGPSSAETAENVRNTVAAALVAGIGINIVDDGTANTITISATGGGGGGLDTEAVQDTVAAMLLEGSGLTSVYDDTAGTYTISTVGLAAASHNHVAANVTDLTEAVQDIVANALVGEGASVSYNDTTGVITISVAAADTETIQDMVATMILEGSGLVAVYNDVAGTYTISVADTDWIDLTYEAAYSGATVGQLGYRVRNNVCYLRGGGKRTAGNWPAGQDGLMHTICANGIPLAYRPSAPVDGAGRATAGRVGFWNVTVNGSVQITPERDSGGTDWVSVANASWPVG